MTHTPKNGFSLIELLVAMAMASILMVAIVSTYTVQVRSKNTQESLTDMNQTARAVLEIMTGEIRMAGLDPLETAAPPGVRLISVARTDELIFAMDRMSNGPPVTNAPDGDCCDGNEQVRYHLTNDADNDGVNDAIVEGVECHLGRETGAGLIAAMGCAGGGTGGLQPMARNVDVLNFVYLDETGAVIPAPGGIVPANRLDDIRAIEVTIVARAGTTSGGLFYDYTDTNAYFNLRGQQVLPAQGDGFRRLPLSTTIACRNVGL